MYVYVDVVGVNVSVVDEVFDLSAGGDYFWGGVHVCLCVGGWWCVGHCVVLVWMVMVMMLCWVVILGSVPVMVFIVVRSCVHRLWVWSGSGFGLLVLVGCGVGAVVLGWVWPVSRCCVCGFMLVWLWVVASVGRGLGLASMVVVAI